MMRREKIIRALLKVEIGLDAAEALADRGVRMVQRHSREVFGIAIGVTRQYVWRTRRPRLACFDQIANISGKQAKWRVTPRLILEAFRFQDKL